MEYWCLSSASRALKSDIQSPKATKQSSYTLCFDAIDLLVAGVLHALRVSSMLFLSFVFSLQLFHRFCLPFFVLSVFGAGFGLFLTHRYLKQQF